MKARPGSSDVATGEPAPWAVSTFGHPLVRAFFGWADDNSCLPGALRLLAIAGDAHRPLLLGGLTGFIARGHIIDLLSNWKQESDPLAPVHELALRIWGSMDLRARLPAADPAERIVKTFRGEVSHHPVAILCAAGQSPTSDVGRVWIDQLRTFVLAVALAYAEAGNLADRHVATVSRHLRRACDDPNADRLLAWFLRLRIEASSLGGLSDALAARCKRAGASRTTHDWLPASLVSALGAVAQRRELPGTGGGLLLTLSAIPRPATSELPPLITPALEEPGELPGDEDAEGVIAGAIDVPPDASPDQSAKLAKGLCDRCHRYQHKNHQKRAGQSFHGHLLQSGLSVDPPFAAALRFTQHEPAAELSIP
jgi:hypothetical protein